ncbi:MAG TPA: amidohydrolase family protein [Kofleriaceae bacterium]|nr:amidohydrolase family protein [Kofleriaceae bacterium]
MIIDCHCHAGEGDGFTGPWDTAAPIDRYLARARRAGITHTVVFSAFHSDYAAANRRVAEIVATLPERLIGFAFVNPRADAGRVAALVARSVRAGFVGLKVHQHDGRITREVCDAARRHDLPVLYDVMGEVTTIALVAREYPEVSFIVPHLGSFADDYRAQVALIDLMVRLPNVFADTAGVRRFDLLEEAVARAGAHKLLFGSDGPWLHPGVELAKIRELGLRPEAERKVLGGNLVRLIGRRAARLGRPAAAVIPVAGRDAAAAPGR